MKPRQIDIVGQDIRPVEPEFDTEDQLSFYIEMWFDCDKYFGVNTANDDDVWLNFYVMYHRKSDTITTQYTLDNHDFPEVVDWELTKEEENYIRQKLNDFCMEDAQLPLKEWFDKFINE